MLLILSTCFWETNWLNCVLVCQLLKRHRTCRPSFPLLIEICCLSSQLLKVKYIHAIDKTLFYLFTHKTLSFMESFLVTQILQRNNFLAHVWYESIRVWWRHSAWRVWKKSEPELVKCYLWLAKMFQPWHESL